MAEAYVALLADTGIAHGLIGPREAPRLWDRHVLNSAVAAPVFDPDARVADIGSGAGLPGIPLAIVRPDLHLTLVEPLLRRTVWLTAAIDQLGLTNVDVHRGRAESLWGETRFRHVTARAVARTGELARLTLPLLEAGGSLHALKGGQVDEELEADAAQLRALGARRWSVSRFGAGVVDPETVVVSVEVDTAPPVPSACSEAPGGPVAEVGAICVPGSLGRARTVRSQFIHSRCCVARLPGSRWLDKASHRAEHDGSTRVRRRVEWVDRGRRSDSDPHRRRRRASAAGLADVSERRPRRSFLVSGLGWPVSRETPPPTSERRRCFT